MREIKIRLIEFMDKKERKTSNIMIFFTTEFAPELIVEVIELVNDCL
jgi:hypothetical protein